MPGGMRHTHVQRVAIDVPARAKGGDLSTAAQDQLFVRRTLFFLVHRNVADLPALRVNTGGRDGPRLSVR